MKPHLYSILLEKGMDIYDVAIYVNEVQGGWSPKSFFVGGTEEYVMETAFELAKLTLRVAVYHNSSITDECVRLNNVDFRPRMEYAAPSMLLLAVKDVPSPLCANGKNIYFTNNIHDTITSLGKDVLINFDKIIAISKYQVDTYLGQHPKVCIIPHACRLSDFSADQKEPCTFLYTSSPDRGLGRLLSLWRDIHRLLNRKAVLHVTYAERPKDFKEDASIIFHGKIHAQEMNALYNKCTYWVHPCDGVELFCISAYKAQAAGCIPIYKNAMALPETIRGGYGAETFEVAVAMALADTLSNDIQIVQSHIPPKPILDWRDVTRMLLDCVDLTPTLKGTYIAFTSQPSGEVRRLIDTGVWKNMWRRLQGLCDAYQLDWNNMTIVDVGAARGEFVGTLVAIAPRAKFQLFEADRRWSSELGSLCKLANVEHTMHFMALSGCDREAREFWRSDISPDGYSSFYPENQMYLHENPLYRSETVETRSMDSVLLETTGFSTGAEKIALIKIDVQGAEIDVVRGAYRIIQIHQPLILMEVPLVPYNRNSATLQEIINEMSMYKYKVLDVFDVHEFKDAGGIVGVQMDMLFAPNSFIDKFTQTQTRIEKQLAEDI